MSLLHISGVTVNVEELLPTKFPKVIGFLRSTLLYSFTQIMGLIYEDIKIPERNLTLRHLSGLLRVIYNGQMVNFS